MKRWIAGIVILLLVGVGASRLRFNVEVLDLLPTDDPSVRGLRLYQSHFAGAGELVISVAAPDAEASEEAAGSLATHLAAHDDLVASVVWQPPWMESPAQFGELIAFLWLNQPPDRFALWSQRLGHSEVTETLQTARDRLATSFSPSEIARLSYDPLGFTELSGTAQSGVPQLGEGQDLFVSDDGTFRILFVQARGDLTNYRACMQWLGQIRLLIDRWAEESEISRSVKISLTGRPTFVSEIAGGMERDMTATVIGTSALIAVLFWLMHRRWRPLGLLLLSLVVVLGVTISLGGLIFGTLNVVSTGFAAVLLGLAADYGMVLFQEHQIAPHSSAAGIRNQVGRGIAWSAATTATAFALLNVSGLPGMGELGSLVSIGIMLAALIMLFGFLPAAVATRSPGSRKPSPPASPAPIVPARLPLAATLAVGGAALAILSFGLPPLEATPDALRPRNSPAYEALETIQERMGGQADPVWVVLEAPTAQQMSERLALAQELLEEAVASGLVKSYSLPTDLWPAPEIQRINRQQAAVLARAGGSVLATAEELGFTDESLALARTVSDTWSRAAASDQLFWPTNDLSRWILDKFVSGTEPPFLVAGLVHPRPEAEQSQDEVLSLEAWGDELAEKGVLLAGWRLVGQSVLEVVLDDLRWVVTPIVTVLLVALFLTFRRGREVVLSLLTLCFSGTVLLAVMRSLGWSWNLLNLMALPLLLGAAVDYSIHVQLALVRHDGNQRALFRSVGRALLLCAATTAIGFGSLIFSSNAGLASLGRVCSVGIWIAFGTSLLLLPFWWRLAERRKRAVR